MIPLLDLRGRAPGTPLNLPRPDLTGEGPVNAVRDILAQVRERGDAAIRELTERFDKVSLDEFRVAPAEIAAARNRIDPDLLKALEAAAKAIEAFHRHRSPLPAPYVNGGVTITHLELPVERAGLYVPGGKAKYPSSVLMTAIPARVAGVQTVMCCTPPGRDGKVPDVILASASVAKVDEVYSIGGAQAIAAMAYGTKSIKRVDVVVGPGSQMVSIAQREVRGVVGVPAAFAGPSEVVVIADETTPVDWAAMDVIVQAEHGPDGLAWLVTWSEKTALEAIGAIERLVELSPRRDETLSTLERGGYVVLVDDADQAMEVANEIAPEHLELLVDDAEHLVGKVRNAGAIFVGQFAPASLGDYIAGPSHVLPTFRTARFSSVLGVEDFVRRVHAVAVNEVGINELGPHVVAIADAEGLSGHAESVRMRQGTALWEMVKIHD